MSELFEEKNVYVPTDYRVGSKGIIEEVQKHTSLYLIIVLWVFGCMFSELVIRGGFGISVPILVTTFYIIAAVFFKGKENAFSKVSMILIVPIAIISVCFVFVDSGITTFVNVLVLLVLIFIQLTAMSGNLTKGISDSGTFIDAMKSFIGVPIQYLDMPFKALNSTKKGTKSNKTITKVLVGLLCAIPLVIIFLALFSSADEEFATMFRNIVEKIDFGIDNIIVDAIIGFFAAVYLGTVFLTMRGRKKEEDLTDRKLSKISSTTIVSFLFAINVVQILFVIVQFKYMFKSVDITSISDHARQGFFELCVAVGLVAVIIMFIAIFCKRRENGKMSTPLSISLTVLILCNYVIFASSMKRMMDYMTYDLTIKRVATMWLMTLFILCFIGVTIYIWAPKLKIFLWVTISVIVMTIGLNCLNVDRLVAKHNIDKYIASKTATGEYEKALDIDVLHGLSLASVPEVDRLFETPMAGEAKTILEEKRTSHSYDSWRNFKVSFIEADRIFEKRNIEIRYDRITDYYYEEY